MKDLRETKKILGMEITRDRDSGRLWLSQENYILKVLERFNMTKVLAQRPSTLVLMMINSYSYSLLIIL